MATPQEHPPGTSTLGALVGGPVTIGVPVRDLDAALTFHRGWIGRDPDLVPVDGMVEWRVTEGCYLQFFRSDTATGSAIVRLAVTDVDAAVAAALRAGLAPDPVEDVGVVKFSEFRDGEGNRFGLVQEVPRA